MSTLHAPEQERSARSLSRLLNAAERLMRERDFDDISIAAIVKEAGTSVGNFYGRFASKEALLDALHERYQSDRAQLWHEFFKLNKAGDALEIRVRNLVRAVIKNYRERSGVFRTLVARQWRRPERIDRRARESLGELYEAAAVFLLECRREIRHQNPERAVEVGIAAILAACRENVIRPKSMPASLKLGDQDLVDELSQMFLAYLTAPPLKVGKERP